MERVYPRPAGYAAQTRVQLRDLMVPALLDSGATVSAIPEEVLCSVSSYFQSRVGDQGGDDDDDD
eukprot:422396-Alexandrium_andersonii.AAC.1